MGVTEKSHNFTCKYLNGANESPKGAMKFLCEIEIFLALVGKLPTVA